MCNSIDRWPESAIRRIRELSDEIDDLHMVAQGIKHYWDCPRDVVTHGQGPVCLRCQLEDAKAEIADLQYKAAKEGLL